MSIDFTTLPVLSDERLGAAVVGRNDEYFALADNLLKPEAPKFVPDLYTKRGKWMDGWETRRRRSPGNDWCIVRLGAAGVVRGVVVDTSHFTGNYPKECWLEGCSVDGYPSADELEHAEWMPLGPRTPLSGNHKHLVNVSVPARLSHVRLTINPDGGVARLRVHGEPVPDPREVWGMPLDLAGLEHGGVVVDCSDMYFSHRHNLNVPTSPQSMADGWETRRRRGGGNDWVVVRLVEEGVIRIAEVDTRFFKGNAPASFSLDGRRDKSDWRPLHPNTNLRAHMRHRFRVVPHEAVTHVRLNIYPDGGIARLRLWGALSDQGAQALGLRWLDTLTPSHAEDELLAVCGSKRWAAQVAAGRPYGSMQALREAAARSWAGLSREDRLEAFAAHPRIGERERPVSAWSREEQAGTAGAETSTVQALETGNRDYESKFGHVFLLSASGLGPDDMLDALQSRIGNDAQTEHEVATAEQQKIIDLRLEKLLRP